MGVCCLGPRHAMCGGSPLENQGSRPQGEPPEVEEVLIRTPPYVEGDQKGKGEEMSQCAPPHYPSSHVELIGMKKVKMYMIAAGNTAVTPALPAALP